MWEGPRLGDRRLERKRQRGEPGGLELGGSHVCFFQAPAISLHTSIANSRIRRQNHYDLGALLGGFLNLGCGRNVKFAEALDVCS